MTNKRKVEIFSAGCQVCQDTIERVENLACPSCDVSVLDISDEKVAERAKDLGLRRLPAVVVDGVLAECCSHGIDEDTLKTAGIGQRQT